MSDMRAETSLSAAELVVLACLSQKKEPSDDDLANAVLELCTPGQPPAHARAVALDATETLQRRGLVTARVNGTSKGKNKNTRRKLTDTGARALCTAVGVTRKPTWTAVRNNHLPALGLGLQPGAAKTMSSAPSIVAAVLCAKFGIRGASTAIAVCDALIADCLGLPPGKVTLDRIRNHVLTQRTDMFHGATEKPAKLAPRIAAALVGAPADDAPSKQALLLALSRRGLQRDSDAPSTRVAYTALHEPPPELTNQGAPLRLVPPPSRVVPTGTAPPPQPSSPTRDLFDEVRDAIRQIGADGRFGTEKVFVSALWHRIEGAGHANLSFDGFKRWLLDANRDGRLVLARADLVGAMDPKQVAESEIRDVAATFHFVLDAQRLESSSQGGSHVR